MSKQNPNQSSRKRKDANQSISETETESDDGLDYEERSNPDSSHSKNSDDGTTAVTSPPFEKSQSTMLDDS